MSWTKQHDLLLCREVLVIQPFKFKQGSRDRGQCWDRIAANLNLAEHPKFAVDQRAVRDRLSQLEKDFKRKRADEERSSGICPDEPDELDQALEEIIEMAESSKEEITRGAERKRGAIEKERESAEAMRKRAMERLEESGEKENTERERKKRKIGGDAVEFLKEKGEQENKIKLEQLNIRKREMELKERKQENEFEMRRKEQEMRERDQCMRERELGARMKRDEDIIFVLKNQLQQQQAILEQVQQQNRLLMSLYQNSLEKKE